MTEEYLSVKQVQTILHVSERTVFNLMDRGELKGFKGGRAWLFAPADVEAYIALKRIQAEMQQRERQAKRAKKAAQKNAA